MIREDILKKTVGVLQMVLNHPEEGDWYLPDDKAYYNALTRLSSVAFGVFTGGRNFEMVRMRPGDIDLDDLWVSIFAANHIKAVPVQTPTVAA